ncbi:MAG: hypothetical protein AB7P97_06675 [Hyphomonadaceae bacterium]
MASLRELLRPARTKYQYRKNAKSDRTENATYAGAAAAQKIKSVVPLSGENGAAA